MRISAPRNRPWNRVLAKMKGTSHRFRMQTDTLIKALGEAAACCTKSPILVRWEFQLIPVSPVLPSTSSPARHENTKPPDMQRSWAGGVGTGAELEQPLGLRRAGCCVWRATGCPWARAVPTHPVCLIRSCTPVPNPPGTARLPRPRGASPVDPAWSKVPPRTMLTQLCGAQWFRCGPPAPPPPRLSADQAKLQ